jgi:hypothetical protein
MFQVSDNAGDLLETPFYFRGICETCPNAAPNPGHAARRRQLTRQLHDHRRIIVCVEERQGGGQPLPSRHSGDQVQHKINKSSADIAIAV